MANEKPLESAGEDRFLAQDRPEGDASALQGEQQVVQNRMQTVLPADSLAIEETCKTKEQLLRSNDFNRFLDIVNRRQAQGNQNRAPIKIEQIDGQHDSQAAMLLLSEWNALRVRFEGNGKDLVALASLIDDFVCNICIIDSRSGTIPYSVEHVDFFQRHMHQFMAQGLVPVLHGGANPFGQPLQADANKLADIPTATAKTTCSIQLKRLPTGITYGDFIEPASLDVIDKKAREDKLGFSEEYIGSHVSFSTCDSTREDPKKRWEGPATVPNGKYTVETLEQAIQYGSALFEGMGVEMNEDGEVHIFRLVDHWQRMDKGGQFYDMPPIPEDVFTRMAIETVQANLAYVPDPRKGQKGRLYLRPNWFGLGPKMKVGNPDQFALTFTPVSIGSMESYFSGGGEKTFFMPTNFFRAMDNGAGQTKGAGNYASTIKLIRNVTQKENGMAGVLFMDPAGHRVEETNASSVIFVQRLKDGNMRVITPSLEHGTILDSQTRKTLLTLSRNELNWEIAERDLPVAELSALSKPDAEEPIVAAFAVGTGAGLSPIHNIQLGDFNSQTGDIQKNGELISFGTFDPKNPAGEAGKQLAPLLLAAKSGKLAKEKPEYASWLTRVQTL